MKIWQKENFSFNKPWKLDLIKNNDICIDCNFAQKVKDTAILVGVTGLQIVGGNHCNAIFPADSRIGGLYADCEPFTGKGEYDEDGKFVRNLGKRGVAVSQKMKKSERDFVFQEFKKLPKKMRDVKIEKDCKKELEEVE